MRRAILACGACLWLVTIAASIHAGAQGNPAVRARVPDLQGLYNTATITPLERPAALAGKPTLTRSEAEAWAREFLAANDIDRRDGDAASDVTRAYNNAFLDRGSSMASIAGVFRTSIIVDPPDGRIPRLTPDGQRRVAAERAANARPTSDTGENGGPTGAGAYDNPEQRPLAERCLLGFGSTSGPPALPVLYNNFKQIVQTPDSVMILNEMVHDVRVVRLGATHLPPHVRRWMGDSIGHYEGDTLVIDTTNFTDKTSFRGASDRLHVVERITRLDPQTLLYRFTVEDPSVWAQPWSGEYPWVATDDQLFEYACHEANLALGNILSGARFQEKNAASRP